MARGISEFSITTVKRIMSSYSNKVKQKERTALISDNYDRSKELRPTYEITELNFNEITRTAKIVFTRHQKYRTVTRYVTKNYVRYPVYSDWKIRIKTINKSIRLTNIVLENLNSYNDELIVKFADEIILGLNNTDLIPSWLAKKMIFEDYKNNTDAQKTIKNNIIDKNNQEITNCKNKINYIKNNISLENIKKQKLTKKILKKEKQILKIENHKKNFIFSILTFFIYDIFNSKKFKAKLEKIKNKFEKRITEINLIINSFDKKITTINDLLTTKITLAKQQLQAIENAIIELKNTYETLTNEVQILDNSYKENKGFLPLKNFIGLDYEQIIGCYIIHNVENDKYYIGQSKDVLKRIKQHFNGTTPKNIIFAEDYYKSTLENVNLLFEVKIIKCQTKDELDTMERELIENYDSCANGYNNTNGNV